MAYVPRERKRPQTIKMIFSWRSTRGGGGGNSPWRAHHMGERKGKERNKKGKGEWRGIGMKQRGSGRLGNACQGIA
jgi:hypothetical protein